MEHKLILDWNTNYLLYMLFLILLTGLTMFAISIIRLVFSFSSQVFGRSQKRNKKRTILSYFLAFMVGCLNSVGIFFYMFSNIQINFIILTFIPVILIICICWSIRLSCVAAIPSVIVYLGIGFGYLKISPFDILTILYAFFTMFTGAFFCKVYNVKKYSRIFLIQLSFSLFCAFVMSITLNSADNIYVIYNGVITPLKDIKITTNFTFYFVNIILVNITSNLINLVVFMLFYWTTKKSEIMINNVLVINNLSYYLDGIFVNNKIGLRDMKEEVQKDEFYLNICIYLPNVSGIIPDIDFKKEKEIKAKIIEHLEHKFKQYNPIYYKNKWGFYCLLISLKEFNISDNLNELYQHKNKKFNEIYNYLKNYVTQINYNNQSYPYSIKNFMSLYGIHTYDFNELDDISYKLFNENKNSNKNVFLYNPSEKIINDHKIKFSEFQQIDKTKFNIIFLENKNHKNIIEPNISYAPYLLISKNHLYQYLDEIDDSNKIKRYLALEVLKKFKKEEKNFKGCSIVIDYPEQVLLEETIDVNYLTQKISQYGHKNNHIIFKFSNEKLYEDCDFFNLINELRANKFKVWLSDVTIEIFKKIIDKVNIDYVSFKTPARIETIKSIQENYPTTVLESEISV